MKHKRSSLYKWVPMQLHRDQKLAIFSIQLFLFMRRRKYPANKVISTRDILFLFILFDYFRLLEHSRRGEKRNNSPTASLDKESSIGGVTSCSRRRPTVGRRSTLQGNNKQKFAWNFGFKMILAGGYRIRTVAETRSFPMYEYKVMINFRTSFFTNCSRILPGLFKSILFVCLFLHLCYFF